MLKAIKDTIIFNNIKQDITNPSHAYLFYGEDEMLREGIPHQPLQDAVEFYGICVREDTYAEESAFVADLVVTLLQA